MENGNAGIDGVGRTRPRARPVVASYAPVARRPPRPAVSLGLSLVSSSLCPDCSSAYLSALSLYSRAYRGSARHES